MLTGILYTEYALTQPHHTHKQVTIIGFVRIALYQTMPAFLISSDTDIAKRARVLCAG